MHIYIYTYIHILLDQIGMQSQRETKPRSSSISSSSSSSSQITNLTCDKFMNILKHIAEDNYLFICNDEVIKVSYQKILDQSLDHIVHQDDLLQFANALKNKNKQTILKEIVYYRSVLWLKQNQDISAIKNKEFINIISECYDQHALTSILQEAVQDAKFVSVQKIFKVIKQIQEKILEDSLEGVSIEKFRQINITKSAINSPISSLVVEDHEEINHASTLHIQYHLILQYFDKYVEGNRYIVELIKQYVKDVMVLEKIEEREEKHILNQRKVREEIISEFEMKNKLLKEIKKVEHQYYDKVSSEERLESICNQLKHKYERQQQKNILLEKEVKELEASVNSCEEENSELRNQNNQIKVEFEELRQNYQEKKEEHSKIIQQYNLLAEKYHQEKNVKHSTENQKIFVTRTLKEELEDAKIKINRQIQENKKIKKEAKERQFLYQKKIVDLEEELQQLNDHLRKKMVQYSVLKTNYRQSDYMRSKLSDLMESNTASMSSNINQFQQKQKIQQRESIKIEREVKRQKPIEGSIIESIVNEIAPKMELNGHSSFKKKKKDIQYVEIYASEENSDQKHLSEYDGAGISELQIVEEILNEDQEVHEKQEKSQRSAEKQEKSQRSASKKSKDKHNTHFSALAILISKGGNKFQKSILFTKKRFCYFDTKNRLQRFLYYKDMKGISFCYHNENAFVIKLKKARLEHLDPHLHINNDIVFTLNQRKDLIRFIAMYLKDKFKRVDAKVSFEREEYVFMRQGDKEINLKQYERFFNPFRLALSNCENVFNVLLDQRTIFSSLEPTLLVIQQLGIFCFKGSVDELEVTQELIMLLPFVEKMILLEKEDSKTHPGRKLFIKYDTPDWSKEIAIITHSKIQMKRLKEAIKGQITYLDKRKKERVSVNEKFFVGLRKSSLKLIEEK